MIVVMKPDATAEQIEHMAQHITVAGADAPGDPGNAPDRHRRDRRGAAGADRGRSSRARGSRRSCRSWPPTSGPRRS